MMKTKFIWVILFYKKKNSSKLSTQLKQITNNQQKLKYIKNLWAMNKIATAAYKCAFRMDNKK